MFHSDNIRLKNLKEKLINQFDEEKKVINQDIYIRDIFVYSLFDKTSFGEYKNHSNAYQQYEILPRLIDHVKSLANTVNEYHKKYYCEKNKNGTYTIKNDCLNKITRILLHEFSLYSARPLTMDEFSLFMNAIHKIASQKKQNVHLLLSSMAVMTEDNQILNLSLYIQCGQEPKIETFCKGSYSKYDLTYKEVSTFSQEEKPHTSAEARAISEKLINISEYIASEKGNIISNNTLFYVTTAGGATYLQAVDVCLDYAYQHAKVLLKKRLNLGLANIYDLELISSLSKPEKGKIYLAEDGSYFLCSLKGEMIKGKINTEIIQLLNGDVIEREINTKEIRFENLAQRITENDFKDQIFKITLGSAYTLPNAMLIPNQADSVVSSNSIRLVANSTISDSTVQIDPEVNLAIHMKNDKMTVFDLKNSKKNKYTKMYIDEFAGGYLVGNPSFGSSYKVVATEERKLGEISSDLKESVNNWNNKVKKQIIESKLEKVKNGEKYNMLVRPANNHPLNNLAIVVKL